MNTPALIASIGCASVVGSYLIHLGRWLTLQFYSWDQSVSHVADIQTLMPGPTRLAVGQSGFLIIAVLAAALVGVVTVLKGRRALRTSVLTVCGQALVVWVAFFCFCYGAFQEPLRLTRPSDFELGSFVAVYEGAFPMTLMAILACAVTAAFGRGADENGHNQSRQPTAAQPRQSTP